MAVTVTGRLVGYEVDGYTTKEGVYRERHTLLVSTGDAVEPVDVPSELVASFSAYREDDAFGTPVSLTCRHRLGYRNYERTSVLQLVGLINLSAEV